MNNVYDPLVLSKAFKPVTLFLDIKGTQRVSAQNIFPKGCAMFRALSDLQLENINLFSISYISSNYSFESIEITNYDSFKNQ